ncbi:MAG: alpha/beta fold hydrolase [Acidobacteria bacterium]|nr:alpha/beta fold hydrolase [Acidobacteriota bacterium]
MSLSGHAWTLGIRFGYRPEPPPSEPWSTTVEDPRLGPVRLTGLLDRGAGETLVLAVHGLGGSAASHYMVHLARRAGDRGHGCLRLNLRGSDRLGEDFYHAGLTADLDAALASPELAGYRRIYLVGCSLGGHVVLRWAVVSGEPRVAALAAVCAPLDLELSSRALHRRRLWLYRRYLLGSLKEIYGAVAARREVPIPATDASRIGTITEWDERIVAPRHGFADAQDYYRRMSVAPRLGELTLPGLLIAADEDPMVPAHTVRPVVRSPPPALTVRWAPRGGHLGFPKDLDLGLGPHRGWAEQVLDWLSLHP